MNVNIINLPGDSADYHVLYNAACQALKNTVEGMMCEIGLRRGGGSRHVIDAMVDTKIKRPLIAIDPYGNIEYETSENYVTRHDYTNNMRDDCMMNMFAYTKSVGVNFIFFNLEDTEFFNRYPDGVPTYSEVKKMETQYALVHFDGPHCTKALEAEVEFFYDRMSKGGMWVFDDVGNYDHDKFEEEVILPLGFELEEKTARKASYCYK